MYVRMHVSWLLLFNDTVTKRISAALLLYPDLGLALSESNQWRSYAFEQQGSLFTEIAALFYQIE